MSLQNFCSLSIGNYCHYLFNKVLSELNVSRQSTAAAAGKPVGVENGANLTSQLAQYTSSNLKSFWTTTSMQGIACRRFPFLCSSSIPSTSIGWQNVTTANYLITSNSTVPRRVYCIQIGCRNKNVLFKFPSLEFHLNQPPHFFNQMNRTWLLTTEGGIQFRDNKKGEC